MPMLASANQRQVVAAAAGVGGLDQAFKHVQRRVLDAVAEQELLAARKALQGRHQPDHEAVVRLQRRAR